jgi:hypothetical protein
MMGDPSKLSVIRKSTALARTRPTIGTDTFFLRMGTEEGMCKATASSVGSDDVLQVERKWTYLLRCEPWYQDTRAPQPWDQVPGHFFIFFIFFGGCSFFQGLDEIYFLMNHFQVSQDFDESLSSLSRLG